MNKPVLNNSTIEKYGQDPDVIQNTVKQIIKDFGLFGIEITFSGDEFKAYKELKTQIIPVLTNLYQENNFTFNALLYRIDVDEKSVQQIFKDVPKNCQAEALSSLIIQREFVKCVYKKLYS